MHRTIVIQERRRLLRDGLALILDGEPDFEVAGTAADPGRLVERCVDLRPDIVLLELDADEWDAGSLIRSLHRRLRTLQIVGLTDHITREQLRLRIDGLHSAILRADGVTGVVAALRGLPGTSRLSWLDLTERSDADDDEPARLTPRERQVLELIGDGLTTREISATLDISPKTVENHKQRVYGKLGVNNQAHAVAIALRTGLVRPSLRATVS